MMNTELKKKLLDELMDDLDMKEGETALKPKVAELSVTKLEPVDKDMDSDEGEEEVEMPLGKGAMMDKVAGVGKHAEDCDDESDLKKRLKHFMGGSH